MGDQYNAIGFEGAFNAAVRGQQPRPTAPPSNPNYPPHNRPQYPGQRKPGSGFADFVPRRMFPGNPRSPTYPLPGGFTFGGGAGPSQYPPGGPANPYNQPRGYPRPGNQPYNRPATEFQGGNTYPNQPGYETDMNRPGSFAGGSPYASKRPGNQPSGAGGNPYQPGQQPGYQPGGAGGKPYQPGQQPGYQPGGAGGSPYQPGPDPYGGRAPRGTADIDTDDYPQPRQPVNPPTQPGNYPISGPSQPSGAGDLIAPSTNPAKDPYAGKYKDKYNTNIGNPQDYPKPQPRNDPPSQPRNNPRPSNPANQPSRVLSGLSDDDGAYFPPDSGIDDDLLNAFG